MYPTQVEAFESIEPGKVFKIFNLDLHASVVEDVKDIAKRLYGNSVEITNWSISDHNHFFNKPTAQVNHINNETWKNIDMDMITRFQDEYDEFLKGFDGFLVTFSPVLAMIYEKYEKPIIVVNACRYDQPFCWNNNTSMLKLFNNSLKRMDESKQMIMVSNNLAEQEYLKKGSGVDSILIPSLCLYTNAHYSQPTKDNYIVFENRIVNDIKSLPNSDKIIPRPRKYEFSELADYKGIIHMPYDISSMSLFEQYFSGIPLFFPEKEFYKKCVQEDKVAFIAAYNSPNKKLNNEELEEWLKNADYYNFKYINYYNSFEDCVAKVNAFNDPDKDARLAWIEKVKEKALKDWRNIFDSIMKGY